MKKYIIVIAFLIYYSLYPQAGSFDTTFDGDGKTMYCFTPNNYHASLDYDFQSNGKIVSLGSDSNCFDLVRFNTDGSLDTTFGTNGYVGQLCNLFPNGGYYERQMVIQSDDKILIMGNQQNGVYPNAYWVVRLLPNGTMDTSFNGTGYLDVSLGTPQDRGSCIALQPDGKILLGGTSGSTAQYFTMIRLTTTGAFDTTFGTNGVVQTAFDGSPQSIGTCIAVQPDGKLVMGGYTQTSSVLPFNFGVVRYMPNGTLDPTFGTGGKIATDIISTDSDQATDVLVQPDGKIVLAGCAGTNTVGLMTAVRYLPNGTLDTSFADNGILQIPNSASVFFNSVALQTDGKLVFGGGGNGVFAIYRYNSDGTADTAFGNNGFVDGMGNYASKVLIQPNQKIVIGGSYIDESNTPCLLIERLNPGELGVEEFASSTAMLYPNPTTGILNFTTDIFRNTAFSIQIYNTLGQLVVSKQNMTQNDTSIDVGNLVGGNYFIVFSNNEKTITKTIIVNKN